MSEVFRSRQSLTLGLIITVEKLFPNEKLHINYSILDGIYAEFSDSVISPREVKLIENHLKEWVDSNSHITCEIGPDGFFHCINSNRTIKTVYPSANHSKVIENFALIPFHQGFVLHFPSAEPPYELKPFLPPEKLSETFSQTFRWIKNLNLSQVADINRSIENDPTSLIYLAEALHEKNISDIADMILSKHRHIKVILISGPSSSGKTTFAQRLSTQLRVNGLKPVSLSLDNYFIDRERTPKDANGQYNYEALEALDLPLLDQQVSALIRGEEVETPVYNFLTGKREPLGKKMQLSPDNILIIEGIHGLNPSLIPSLDRSQLFKIYVSSLFQLNIDPYNRIPTTLVRLIRRIVRDHQFRGITPERTLKQWNSVRHGENTYIFPYQEEADVMFNSSLIYELNALRPYAEPLLASIPQNSTYYHSAQHCLRVLSFFKPLTCEKIPYNSILREFLGGSIFEH